jgi:predicted acyltransferase
MSDAKILIVGVLALIAFSAVTAIIVVAAPYIAVVAIVLAVCWAAVMAKHKPEDAEQD